VEYRKRVRAQRIADLRRALFGRVFEQWYLAVILSERP